MRTGIVVAVLMLVGCGWGASIGSCAEQYGKYDVIYSGAAGGLGRILLERKDEDPGLVGVSLDLLGDGADRGKVLMSIRGVGTCSDGLAQVRFDAMAGENARFKIVGGSMVGVFVPGVVSRPFGHWEMVVFDKGKGSQQEMTGFWRQLDITREGDVRAGG